MSGNVGGWTGSIVLVGNLLLLGAPKLPGLAKSLGQSLKIFKSEVRPGDESKEQASDQTGSESPDTSKP